MGMLLAINGAVYLGTSKRYFEGIQKDVSKCFDYLSNKPKSRSVPVLTIVELMKSRF